MLRLLAGMLVLYGSIGFSLKLCQEMRQRLKHLEQMQEIFRLFQAEVSYSRTAFPEVCMAVSDRVSEPYKTAMRDIYGQVLEKSGVQFPEIWKENMERCLEGTDIRPEERKIVLDFGKQVGYMDWKMQSGVLEKNRIRLEELYDKQKNAMENKEKVITSMGILGGLMLVIILI